MKITILIFSLAALFILIFSFQDKEISLTGYDAAKEEIVAKLVKHQDYIMTLEGDEEFKLYRENFIKRSNQIIDYIHNRKVRFYEGNVNDAVAYVKGFKSYHKGVFVNPSYVKELQSNDLMLQQVLCNELSHMAFWAEDAPIGANWEDLPRAQLAEYSDWYDAVILFSHNQKMIEKIYVGNREI